MKLYKHSFDLGTFQLYKDEGASALFYKVKEIGEDENSVRIESRLISYAWNEMRIM